MAELADAADSKSAGTWYLGGSTPPPGTSSKLIQLGRTDRAICEIDLLDSHADNFRSFGLVRRSRASGVMIR